MKSNFFSFFIIFKHICSSNWMIGMIELICYVVFVGQVLEEYLTQLKPPQNHWITV